MERHLYQGTFESKRAIHDWMTASAIDGSFHILSGDGTLRVHPGDIVYRSDDGGFGVDCRYRKAWGGRPADVFYGPSSE